MNKTQIYSLLRECAFDPRNQAEMKAISSITNSEYCCYRVQELLDEAKLPGIDNVHFNSIIIKSIRLLILARAYRNGIKK